MIDYLQKLGLSVKESTVYLATLNLGEASPVSTIARKANVHRTTVYDILESLEKKGLVDSHQKDKLYFYRAQPPEKLIAYLTEERQKLRRMEKEAIKLLPELNAQYHLAQDRPKVYFYEGEEGLIRVYEETLTSSEEIRGFASDKANQEHMGWYFPEYYQKRAEHDIRIRIIATDTENDRERFRFDKNELRKTRLVPKAKLDFTPEINFFDNKIMIANWKEKLGVIIESEEIVKVFKDFFELAWEASGKYHKEIEKEIKAASSKERQHAEETSHQGSHASQKLKDTDARHREANKEKNPQS